MTESNPENEPRIIVDDDWKSQVEREKAEAEAQAAASGAGATPEPGPGEIPPASMQTLVSTLATQAMAGLGLLQGPEGAYPPDLDMARHFIDTLVVLEEKTQGNLSEDEATMLKDTLHQLRMVYLQLQQMIADAQNQGTPPESPSSSIELP